MKLSFNTAGPCDPRFHYMLPAEPRLPALRGLIDEMNYVVVHAPRQMGKTTTLRAMARRFTAEGDYAALHFSCEAAKAAEEDFGAAERIILDELQRQSEIQLEPALRPTEWPDAAAGGRLERALDHWASRCPRPLVSSSTRSTRYWVHRSYRRWDSSERPTTTGRTTRRGPSSSSGCAT